MLVINVDSKTSIDFSFINVQPFLEFNRYDKHLHISVCDSSIRTCISSSDNKLVASKDCALANLSCHMVEPKTTNTNHVQE